MVQKKGRKRCAFSRWASLALGGCWPKGCWPFIKPRSAVLALAETRYTCGPPLLGDWSVRRPAEGNSGLAGFSSHCASPPLPIKPGCVLVCCHSSLLDRAELQGCSDGLHKNISLEKFVRSSEPGSSQYRTCPYMPLRGKQIALWREPAESSTYLARWSVGLFVILSNVLYALNFVDTKFTGLEP